VPASCRLSVLGFLEHSRLGFLENPKKGKD